MKTNVFTTRMQANGPPDRGVQSWGVWGLPKFRTRHLSTGYISSKCTAWWLLHEQLMIRCYATTCPVSLVPGPAMIHNVEDQRRALKGLAHLRWSNLCVWYPPTTSSSKHQFHGLMHPEPWDPAHRWGPPSSEPLRQLARELVCCDEVLVVTTSQNGNSSRRNWEVTGKCLNIKLETSCSQLTVWWNMVELCISVHKYNGIKNWYTTCIGYLQTPTFKSRCVGIPPDSIHIDPLYVICVISFKLSFDSIRSISALQRYKLHAHMAALN